jgi:SOS-response transcriptional repressor LexA
MRPLLSHLRIQSLDAANLGQQGLLHPLRRSQAEGNVPDVLRSESEPLGDTAINAVIATSESQIAEVRVKLLPQTEPPYPAQSTPLGVKESIEKTVEISTQAAIPEWAQRINELRRKLKLGQEEFAEAVGVSQQTVSRWVRGEREPSVDGYRSIIHLCGDEQQEAARYFLKRYGDLTGVHDFTARFALDQYPKLNKKLRAAERQMEELQNEKNAVVIPLLKDSAAAGTPRAIDEKEIEAELVLPRAWVSKSSTITAIKVEGDSMSPVLEPGYIVLVDTSQKDPKRLVNQMVAARDDEGVTIKWLRKQPERKGAEEMYILLPNHTSLRHPVRVITPGSESVSIVGKVVKWIGEPPPPRK